MYQCEWCGANLDPAEKCDCQDEINRAIDRVTENTHCLNGQYEFDFMEVKPLKISKIRITNLFGITETELGGESIEFSGKNGVGKTSFLDAIKLALTNKSPREYTVRNGATEGEIYIETDTGLTIDRKYRTQQADYKSVKLAGKEVGSPESFLRDIFTPLQLNPVEFMSMDKKAQNAIILDMIEYDWDLNSIKEWFGEIPSWVSYDQNILSVLNDIQSENGEYFMSRQDINRDARNKRAFVEEIAATLPAGYTADKWENASTGDIYRKIEQIQRANAQIEKAKSVVENKNNKIRAFQADKEIEIGAIEREFAARENQIDTEVAELLGRIELLKQEKSTMSGKKADKIALAEETYKTKVAEFDAQVSEYAQYIGEEPQDTTELQEEAATIERMKKHINEYNRMIKLQSEVESLLDQSKLLTDKIEKARTLPGEILQNCNIPIKGLTVENGIPLINGLPVSNLSEGEKLDLCIDVAIQKPNSMQIILIDGVEKLSTALRDKLYAKCKEKGLQILATRTTDDDFITMREL